jgi:hypothetical protein
MQKIQLNSRWTLPACFVDKTVREKPWSLKLVTSKLVISSDFPSYVGWTNFLLPEFFLAQFIGDTNLRKKSKWDQYNSPIVQHTLGLR